MNTYGRHWQLISVSNELTILVWTEKFKTSTFYLDRIAYLKVNA